MIRDTCNRMVGALLSAILLLMAIGTAEARELRLGIWRSIENLDPVYDTLGPFSPSPYLFEGLVIPGDDGQPRPAQAQSWEISEDGLIYTFTLRHGISWSDGTPVTAADFVAAFRRLADPRLDLDARPTYLIEIVKNVPEVVSGELPPTAIGVRALDERTLEIELTTPASYFLSILTYPGLVPAPRHVIYRHGENWSEQRPLVSNGQFVLQSNTGSELRFERREGHWEQPAFETVVMKGYDSTGSAFQALLGDQLDLVVGLPEKESEYTRRNFPHRVDRLKLPGTIYGVFNTLEPALSSARVRRALGMLVDNTAITDRLGVDEDTAGSTFTPPQFIPPTDDNTIPWRTWSMSERIAEARRLLLLEGFTDAEPLEINIVAGTYNDYDRIAVIIRSMWSLAPVRATITRVGSTELSKRLRGNDYGFAIATWYGDYDDPLTFLGLFAKDGAKNHSDWSYPAYQALLQRALHEPEFEKRKTLYDRMEMILGEEVPAFAIRYPEILLGVSNRIKSLSLGETIINVRTLAASNVEFIGAPE